MTRHPEDPPFLDVDEVIELRTERRERACCVPGTCECHPVYCRDRRAVVQIYDCYLCLTEPSHVRR
jgi:hypothetical protein